MASSILNASGSAPHMARGFSHMPQHAATRFSMPMATGMSLTQKHAIAPVTTALMHNKTGNALQKRDLTSWRLRPYAAAATMGALPLTTLNAGFSKVNLSLMVLPWKALPTALLLLPTAWAVPALMRFAFNNGSRYSTAGFFTAICQLVIAFIPKLTFENMFGELAFYAVALFSTYFMYMLFPEVILNDIILMHYLALFSICFIPLAFTFMPIFTSRAYFFL